MSGNSSIGFVDTNIWLYAFIGTQDRGKHEAAQDLLRQCRPVISTQVINEVCTNLLRKTQSSESEIGRLIASFYDEYEVIALNRSILEHASKLRAR